MDTDAVRVVVEVAVVHRFRYEIGAAMAVRANASCEGWVYSHRLDPKMKRVWVDDGVREARFEMELVNRMRLIPVQAQAGVVFVVHPVCWGCETTGLLRLVVTEEMLEAAVDPVDRQA